MKKIAMSLILAVFVLATAAIASASSNYAIAAAATATTTTTTFNSQSYGPAMIGGAIVGAGPKSGLGLTPTDVYDPELGDALIYGYYNVRNNAVTAFTVLNTDRNKGARVRLRFYEGKNSNEVLDYDICLSPADQYTAYVMMGSATTPSVYSLSTNATDDTFIDYGTTRGASSTNTVTPSSGIPFKQTGSVTADDLTEGYFVVIAENTLSATTTSTTTCGSYYDVYTAGNDVGNVLTGQAYIITSSGKSYAYNATALANFSDTDFGNISPTAATPTLASTTDLSGLDAVNFILTKENARSQYWDFSGTNGTQVIITFPTRALTVKSGTEDDIFDDKKVLLTVWSDDERSAVSGCQYSPCASGSDISLPNEVNLIRIGTAGTTSIFDTKLNVTVPTDYTIYTMGWININFVHSMTESPVQIGTGEYHRTPFNDGQVNRTISPTLGLTINNGYVSWGMPALAYTVNDLGGGLNWMLPMNATTYVNDGTTVAPAP